MTANALSPIHVTDDSEALDRLHHRLAETALETEIMDIGYRIVDSPVGSLLVATTEIGVVRVAFELQDHELVLQQLADRLSPRILRSPRRLDRAARELDEYFAGTRRAFGIPVDLRLVNGFRQVVLDHLAEISYGTTESYSQVAAASGSPRAVRAVGTACALNPIPVIVPCHRVVRSDGTVGEYAGGAAAKRALLALEAAA